MTEEESSPRCFKDALTKRTPAAVGVLLLLESEEELRLATARVEYVYAKYASGIAALGKGGPERE